MNADEISILCKQLQAPVPSAEEQALLSAAVAAGGGLLALEPFKRLAFCVHILALGRDAMAVVAYDEAARVVPLLKHMERCAISARLIENNMEDGRRKEVAAAVQGGAVRVLYVPFARLLDRRFQAYLLGNRPGLLAVLDVKWDTSFALEGWQGLQAALRESEGAPPLYWCTTEQGEEALKHRAHSLGLSLLGGPLEAQQPSAAPVVEADPFLAGMKAGRNISDLIAELVWSEGESCRRVRAYMEEEGETNPLKWVSTASYLAVSKAAAQAATTDFKFIARIVDGAVPLVEVALIVACLANRDRARPDGHGRP